jgi:hypothetical protein
MYNITGGPESHDISYNSGVNTIYYKLAFYDFVHFFSYTGINTRFYDISY